jgi:DNA-binding SARP family transcriptional activator/tetratricopeptide (TPR) repeat protein
VGLVARLLGVASVEVDGAPLSVDTRKAVALLALLLVREDRLGRDTIAGLLWPDASSERARASLRRTLSTLSAGLGGRWVHGDRDHLRFVDDGEVRCDVHEVRAAAAALRAHEVQHGGDPVVCDRCRAALDRLDLTSVGTTLLEGFVLRDAPAFDDWVQVESESLRRDVTLLLERRTALDLADGRAEEALATAHRWSQDDPLHEGAHRAVMLAAAALGRREEAIRQYRRCVATLDRELGVGPLPETTALHDAILGDSPVPAVVAVAAPEPQPHRAQDVALVDRDDELEHLRRVHAGLTAGATCVVIDGEAGIGKTRIAEEFVEYVGRRGAATLVVRCRPDEATLTCGPLSDALRDAYRTDPSWAADLPDDVVAEVARIVPELRAGAAVETAPLDSPGAQVRFLDAVFVAVAATVAGEAPGVVVVDDLHWADPTTVDVLRRGVRRYEGRPVLLVVAWRTELVPHDHPLRQLIDGDASVLRPARLTRAQVAELVEDVRPNALGLVDRLHDETEGIPFFVLEYLTAIADDTWQLPAPVRDLVASRLVPLSDLARQCLTAGAVLGRSFDLGELVRTSGRSDDEVVTALDELLAHRLLDEHGDAGGARYDFTHTKVREVVLQSASLARRRLLHRRAAEAIGDAGDDPTVAVRLARHHREAGQFAEAAEAHRRAGEHAASLFANVEALEHLDAALALGHPYAGELHLAVGDLQALAGRYDEARTSYTAAGALLGEDRTAEVEHRLGILHLRWGAWASAQRHLAEALARLGPGRSAHRARVLADHAVALLRAGAPEEAATEAATAVTDADASGDATARAQAHNTAGLVARHRGDHAGAERHLRTALSFADATPDPALHVAAANNLALVLAAEGQLDAALATAREALERCSGVGDRHREAALHSNVADLLHAAGRTEDALPHLTESARLLTDVGAAARPEPEVWKLTDW